MEEEMIPLFLIGGGWDGKSYDLTYGRFIKASTTSGKRRLMIVMSVENEEDHEEMRNSYFSVFLKLGVSLNDLYPVFLSEKCSLSTQLLEQINPTGVFVCGGLTPLYQKYLCEDKTWLNYMMKNNVPYGGFSAGSAIAPEKAIVGGWKIDVDGRDVGILDPDLAEDLDYLEVRTGLGLTEFSIDVHGSQWGTITRLIHASDQERIGYGWVIDEDTMLQIENDEITIHGLGNAYFVQKLGCGKMEIEILRSGTSWKHSR